jgi:hypothetical protein
MVFGWRIIMSVPLVLNEKQLEKQIKLLEGRIGELRSEMETLERRRQACLVLLGQDAAPAISAPAQTDEAKKSAAKSARKSKLTLEEVPMKIREVLQSSTEPLSADTIYDQLKAQWGTLPGEKPATAVYEALEAHGDWFEEVGDGRWSARGAGAESASPV